MGGGEVAKNLRKKTCSKAKREKEILRDLDVLDRRLDILGGWQGGEMASLDRERINREAKAIRIAEEKLKQELHDLWTEPGIAKKRARARGDHS